MHDLHNAPCCHGKPGETGKGMSLGMVTRHVDPVCGMEVDPATAPASLVHEGQTYYFCNPGCAKRFQAEPQRYLGERPATPPAAAPGSAWICPMDPEVRQDHPGSCPLCGMALEPETPAAPAEATFVCPMHPEIVSRRPGACPKCGMALEPRSADVGAAANPELRDMTRRFWIGVLLGLPVFVIAMTDMLPGGWLHRFDMAWLNRIQLLLATPVVLWCGLPFFQRAWTSVVNRSPNMFTLIALGVGAAYLYSLVATLAPGLFPAGFRTAHDAVEPYFDTAVVVTVLVLLGQMLELRAARRHDRGHPSPAGPRPANRPACRGRRQRDRRAAGGGARRRRAAGATGRKGAGGRRRHRGGQRPGRVDAHRRVAPGRENGGRGPRWRHRERHRLAVDAGRTRRRRHGAVAHRPPGGRGPAQLRRSSAWSTASPAPSCPRCCWSAC